MMNEEIYLVDDIVPEQVVENWWMNFKQLW